MSKRAYLQYCEHCDELVSKSTFYRHRRNLSERLTTRKTAHIQTSGIVSQADTDLQTEQEIQDEWVHTSLNGDQSCGSEDIEDEEVSRSLLSDSDSLYEQCITEDPEIVSDYDSEECDEMASNPIEPSSTHNAIVFLLMMLSKWKCFFTVSDRAFVSLLGVLKAFLQAIGMLFRSENIRHLGNVFPKSMYLVRKHTGFSKDDFIKYIVCSTCNSVYTLDEAVKTVYDEHGNVVRRIAQTCYHVAYPSHPQKKFRQKCNTILMKSILGKGGKEHLYPKKMYCYRSVIESVRDLVKKPDFSNACEKWRSRTVPEGTYADIYDGQVWKDFGTVAGQPFLKISGNLGLMLNVDWFQPYKNTNDSVGVMYLTIMNLPREERCKYKNIIVVGIIPGPKEPTHHINGFLEPVVADLQTLWGGVFCTDRNGEQLLIRAALMCIASDIPAARKVAGFLGHFATRGCSKCTKSFLRTAENKADFSGFEDDWPSRNNTEHCMYAKRAKMAKNKAERARIEGTYGARYSCLHDLTYLNVVRMHVIDPMHNLLEGTAKRVMQVWKEREILTKDNFAVLQERVNSLKLPSSTDSGLPFKVNAGFDGFTAAQWKLWICVYSTYALKGIIPDNDYSIWRMFISAAHLLCSRVISQRDLEDAHRCLKMFCTSFQERYGKSWCTMNMHLHLHLKACIEDYGPVHGFWCFSFERANGTLGQYHTNNRDTELNIMRKWLTEWQVAGSQLTSPFSSEAFDFEVQCVFSTCDALTGDPTIDLAAMTRPGQIQYIWKVLVYVLREDSVTVAEHVVAEVNWFEEHGDKWHYGNNSTCTVWGTQYVPWSHASYIPFKIILGQCASCCCKVAFSANREERVNVVTTIPSARCV